MFLSLKFLAKPFQTFLVLRCFLCYDSISPDFSKTRRHRHDNGSFAENASQYFKCRIPHLQSPFFQSPPYLTTFTTSSPQHHLQLAKHMVYSDATDVKSLGDCRQIHFLCFTMVDVPLFMGNDCIAILHGGGNQPGISPLQEFLPHFHAIISSQTVHHIIRNGGHPFTGIPRNRKEEIIGQLCLDPP